jgi:hypothetical protein
MIVTLLGAIMMRSIERDRPLPAWLRIAARRSRRLAEMERRLRISHERLSASTTGLIGPAPDGLAARTVAALSQRPRGAARGVPSASGRWPGIVLAFVGTLAAAAAVVIVALPSLKSGEPASPPSLPSPIAHPGEPTPLEDDGRRPPGTLVTVLRAPDEIATGALTGGLLTEAQRLRDDTRAAADFVLSRIRILGPAPRQSGG